MGAENPEELLFQLMQADEFGIKLEVVEGDFGWEFFPSPFHQGVVRAIDRSARPIAGDDRGCGCYTLSDAYIEFPDGSLKRPDLMVFCTEPPLTRKPLTVVPEAIVEVLSPGGEKKDLQIGPLFYLSQGVKDVIVVDPERGVAHHFRSDATLRLARPASIRLQCGCELTA